MTGQAPASSLPPSPRALTQRLVIASIISMITLAVVCGFGISSLRRLSALSDTEVAQRMTLLNESEVFQLVLFQKGFAVDYMFTGDERWLRELERSRKEFAEWLPETQRTADSEEERDLLRRIDEAYRALDRERSDMLARYKEGRIDEVKQSLQRTHTMMQSLVSLSQEFVHAASTQARSERDAVQSTMRRDTTLLLGGSLFGMAASLLVGFFVARRVARPIYELQLQVESAAQRTRIEVPPGRAGFEALGEHMGAILRKIEETDAAIAEQRRRLGAGRQIRASGSTMPTCYTEPRLPSWSPTSNGCTTWVSAQSKRSSRHIGTTNPSIDHPTGSASTGHSTWPRTQRACGSPRPGAFGLRCAGPKFVSS